jgi:recombination protein RecA
MALGQIEKQFGKGAVMRMSGESKVKVAIIPTGALALDIALGVGGLPRGRVVEIYGPESSGKTTVALHAIAEAQRAGGIAAFVDAEHALDPGYAAALGVDMDALLVSQPDTGEQALEITDMLVRSGAVDIVVIDSVAALTPRAELEGEMGDAHVGLQARLMSQALRKLAGTLNRSRTCCVFINQLREKVGVMFGCFDWHSRVTLADGTSECIGRIVTQRMPVEVLSYDPETGTVVPKRVIGWFDNGPTGQFLHFRVAGGSRGASRFACTPLHRIRTVSGWRKASELNVGDRVMRLAPHYLSEWQWQVLLGGLMGDGSLSSGGRSCGLNTRYRFGRATGCAPYTDWKASLLSNIDLRRSVDGRGAVSYRSRPLPELAELREAVYLGGRKVLSYDYLKRLTPLSIAIWYMDTAALTRCAAGEASAMSAVAGIVEICVESFERTSRTRLCQHLQDTWGISSQLVDRAGCAVLHFAPAETDKLQALIAPYVHPCMESGLLPHHRGRFAVEPQLRPVRYELVPAPVLSIDRRSASGPNPNRYDIEVERSHNYLAGGVMVHNSPETTPGGRALKFYSSVRLDVRRLESLKDGTDFVGNRVRVKVVKNKVAPPFKQCEFDILFGQGISREGSLLDIGVEHGIIRKAGAWYTYDGEQLGQGRENARRFLKEHSDTAAEIYKRVTEQLGLVPTDVTGDEQGEDASR